MNLYIEEQKLAKELGIETHNVCIVGSTLICGQGSDIDFLCLVENEDDVSSKGFVPDIDASYESPLRSYRRGGQNIIATTDRGFFLAEIATAHAAMIAGRQSFDMSKREDRVSFHSQVRGHVLARMAMMEGSQ